MQADSAAHRPTHSASKRPSRIRCSIPTLPLAGAIMTQARVHLNGPRAASARAVGTVARVAEARDDIAVVVQHLVDPRRPDRNVRMVGPQGLGARTGGEQADEA